MPEARLLQAEILAQQGQVEQAKTTLTALVDDPAAAEWIRNEARSLLEMPGAPPAASEPAPPTSDVEQALQMVQDHPDDPKAHLALALAYAAQKQYDLYTESLNETIRLASADASFLGMAAKDAAAVGDWLTAARLYLALAQNQTGQLPPEQKAPLQEALFQAAGSAEFTLVIDLAVVEQLDPRLAQILRARYTLYFGDPAKAQEIVSGIPIDAETIPEARLVQAEIYIQVGQPDQARLILEQLKSEQRLPPWVRELAKQIFEAKFP
jgi:tetratricopeptide (TPR) repeat protein